MTSSYWYYLCFLLIGSFIDLSRLKKYRKFVRGHINDAVLVSPPVGALSGAVGGGFEGSLWVACGRDKGVSKGILLFGSNIPQKWYICGEFM